MDDQELRSILESELRNTVGYFGGELSSQRKLAFDYYNGAPFEGDDSPGTTGRSKIVLTEVADVIGWILPSLMEIFGANENAVRFDPVGAQDEQAADMETYAVNHVFYKQNKGFMLLYNWFFDALLLKNGYVELWWDESSKKERETYIGLNDEELAELANNPELEPIEYESYSEAAMQDDGTGNPVQAVVSRHNVVFVRTTKIGKICLQNVPPEEICVSRRYRHLCLDECPFFAKVSPTTRSAMIEQGYDREMVDKIPTTNINPYLSSNAESMARNDLGEDSMFGVDINNKAMETIWPAECYIRIDFDGDGIAELRKITFAGDMILENQEIDRSRIFTLCPRPMPHKHYGKSSFDDVADLQQLKSIVARNVLDNFYQINNQRPVCNANVNLDDVNQHVPGAPIRTDGVPQEDIYYPQVAHLGEPGFQMLGWIDDIRENRTGVSKTFQGLNDNIAGDTAHGVERVMTASEQKVKLIARIFAETGVKDLFLGIHELLRKYGSQMELKLKGQWENVDPREWIERNSMTPKVGLGTGDQSKLQGAMLSIQTLQQQVAQASPPGVLVTLDNLYNAAIDFARYSGLSSPEQYFTSPQAPESKQAQQAAAQQEDPNVKFMEMQAQVEQLKAQLKQQEIQYKFTIDQQKLKHDYDIKNAEIELKYDQMAEDATQFYTEAELKYKKNVPGSKV